MGLGPHGTSLLARMGRSTDPISLEALILDREARGQARMIARIRHAEKHKAKVKPLAPVEAMYKEPGKEHERWWIWTGEKPLNFRRKDGVVILFTLGGAYSSQTLREAGFKLPKLPSKKERKAG